MTGERKQTKTSCHSLNPAKEKGDTQNLSSLSYLLLWCLYPHQEKARSFRKGVSLSPMSWWSSPEQCLGDRAGGGPSFCWAFLPPGRAGLTCHRCFTGVSQFRLHAAPRTAPNVVPNDTLSDFKGSNRVSVGDEDRHSVNAAPAPFVVRPKRTPGAPVKVVKVVKVRR